MSRYKKKKKQYFPRAVFNEPTLSEPIKNNLLGHRLEYIIQGKRALSNCTRCGFISRRDTEIFSFCFLN